MENYSGKKKTKCTSIAKWWGWIKKNQNNSCKRLFWLNEWCNTISALSLYNKQQCNANKVYFNTFHSFHFTFIWYYIQKVTCNFTCCYMNKSVSDLSLFYASWVTCSRIRLHCLHCVFDSLKDPVHKRHSLKSQTTVCSCVFDSLKRSRS